MKKLFFFSVLVISIFVSSCSHSYDDSIYGDGISDESNDVGRLYDEYADASLEAFDSQVVSIVKAKSRDFWNETSPKDLGQYLSSLSIAELQSLEDYLSKTILCLIIR